MIVGGGITPSLRRRFADLAGGAAAEIVCVPTALPHGRLSGWCRRFFQQAGVPKKNQPVFHTRTPEKADRASFVPADHIGLRFGRFDVKARSLYALQAGDFHVLEANGSTSLDLTLYGDTYSLPEKIERLRAHWDEFFHQARPRVSPPENSWELLGTLLWFAIAPGRCVGSLRHEIDDRELGSRA